MPQSVTLPEGVEWADPPERALARRKRGANTAHAAAIDAMKARPRKWLRVGLGGKDAVQRWRHGKIAGTAKGEFEAVIDLAAPTDTRGGVYVRYVGSEK